MKKSTAKIPLMAKVIVNLILNMNLNLREREREKLKIYTGRTYLFFCFSIKGS